MDDIFNAIRLIEKYLPKPTYTIKETNSLTCRDLINDKFKLKENTLITQSVYIKGRPPVEKEFPHIYEHVLCRSSSWSFLDCNNSNFVVDDLYYKDEISSPIYIVDLDSYKECSIEKRKERWKIR